MTFSHIDLCHRHPVTYAYIYNPQRKLFSHCGISFPYSSRKWYRCFLLENKIYFQSQNLSLQGHTSSLT